MKNRKVIYISAIEDLTAEILKGFHSGSLIVNIDNVPVREMKDVLKKLGERENLHETGR